MKKINENSYLDSKKNALKKLEDARKKNLVDHGIVDLLDIINKSENYYTSSSCEGRIVILELPVIGDKKNAEFLGKWHRKITESEIISTLKKSKKGQLWFLAQSSIIHIGARTESDAEKILKIGLACGFKNSGLKSIGKKIIVEICSTERFDVPIGKDGLLFCDEKYISLLVETANEMIDRSKCKIARLEAELKKKI